ncbi:MAG: hypothetical protein HKN17_10325 [Rhodothermales bacterium]|nr:hypothetical protein [Rhodothermales bacterium]
MINRFAILLFACALITIGCSSSETDSADGLRMAVSAFDEGNVLLAAGRYRDAATAYDRASTAGMHSVELHYNAALAWYRLDELGRAMLHLERARRIDPENRVVLHGISIVEARREDAFSQLPEPFTIQIHRALMRFMSPPGWFLAGFLLLAAFTVIRAVGPGTNVREEWLRRARFSTIVPAVVLILYAFAASINPPVTESAVVTSGQLVVRDQPADDGTDIVRIHEALVVDLITDAGDWVLIRLPNGTTGWVPSGGLTRV